MENKISKYFKYAIGEIVLVMIGILLALQVNNWNEARKDKIQQHELVSQLLEDAQKDSLFYQSRLTLFANQLKTYDLLSDFLSEHEKHNPSESKVFEESEIPFMAAANQSNIISNKNDYSKITDKTIKMALRDYTISYNYISIAIDTHRSTVIKEVAYFTRRYDIPYAERKNVKLSDFIDLRNEPKILGIIRLCKNFTKNAVRQTERFVVDNQKLIKDCKMYLND